MVRGGRKRGREGKGKEGDELTRGEDFSGKDWKGLEVFASHMILPEPRLLPLDLGSVSGTGQLYTANKK
jgi:hypothetical protein